MLLSQLLGIPKCPILKMFLLNFIEQHISLLLLNYIHKIKRTELI